MARTTLREETPLRAMNKVEVYRRMEVNRPFMALIVVNKK
jgi:hypothetical protein